VVSDDFLKNLLDQIQKAPETKVKIDLKQQLLIVSSGESTGFEINPYKKECMINGLDDIDYLLNITDVIKAYEFRKTLGK